MKKNEKKKFVEALHQYGIDFERIVDTKKLGDTTIDQMRSEYPEVLESYLQTNTALSEKETDWIQIKELYYFKQKFYFDVLVEGPDKTSLSRTGEELKAGKELVLLLKDYEFSLLSKLSILHRLYEVLFSDGFLKKNPGNKKVQSKGSKRDPKKASSSRIGDEAQLKDAVDVKQIIELEDIALRKGQAGEKQEHMPQEAEEKEGPRAGGEDAPYVAKSRPSKGMKAIKVRVKQNNGVVNVEEARSAANTNKNKGVTTSQAARKSSLNGVCDNENASNKTSSQEDQSRPKDEDQLGKSEEDLKRQKVDSFLLSKTNKLAPLDNDSSLNEESFLQNQQPKPNASLGFNYAMVLKLSRDPRE